MSYKLPIRTGEILKVLERQSEITGSELEAIRRFDPALLNAITVVTRSEIEDAKLGNDTLFLKKLRSDSVKLQMAISSYKCEERKECKSYNVDKCSLKLMNPRLKGVPRCFKVEDILGREYIEMLIEAVRERSILVLVVAPTHA
jgi:hypothetical protein